MNRKDLMHVLNLKQFKNTISKEMIIIARERRKHHAEAIEELILQNKHIKKRLERQNKISEDSSKQKNILKSRNRVSNVELYDSGSSTSTNNNDQSLDFSEIQREIDNSVSVESTHNSSESKTPIKRQKTKEFDSFRKSVCELSNRTTQ